MSMEPGWYAVEELPFSEDTSPIGWFPSRSKAEIAALDANYPYVSFFSGANWGYMWPVNEPKPTRRHTQSRIDSFMESLTNVVIGLCVSQLANLVVIPLVFGIQITATQNLSLAGLFTIVSIIRQYVLRRLFNGRSPWQAIKGCMSRVSTIR